MTVIKTIEAGLLTVRFNSLCQESQKIANAIGDLPIIFFPEQRKILIEQAEEERELALRLYSLYFSEGEMERVELMKGAISAIDESLYLLTRN